MNKHEKSIETLRAQRAAALASLEAARTECDRATAAASAVQKDHAGIDFGFDEIAQAERALKVVVARIAAVEAEDAKRNAEIAASAACDALEVAQGDELATSCDAASLQADLRAELEAVASLRAQVLAAEHRADQRRDVVEAAYAALAARRAAAGLPLPRSFARQACQTNHSRIVGNVIGKRLSHEELLADLDARIANAAITSDNGLPRLREEEFQLRASIERQKRKAEEKAARHAQWVREQSKTSESEARERAANQQAAAAEQEAHRKANEELAAAHRKRASA